MKKLILLLFISYCSFYNSQETKDSIIAKNGKYGLLYETKVILFPAYDYVKEEIKGFLYVFYKGKDGLLVNNEGVRLAEKVKAIYTYRCDTVQVLDKNNKMYFIDTKRKNPFQCGMIAGNDIVGDVEYKYKIKEDYIVITLHKYREMSRSYIYGYKKGTRNHTFVNGQEELEYEPYWYYQKNYKPLKAELVISKKKNKYGVWDFKEEKIILPFKYDKIIPNNSYLCLEKNGLKTFYPNIGTDPKYKKLEPYIEYFARFETTEGRKGWVDRKGKEYFDD